MIRLRQKSILSYFIQPFFVVFLLCGIFSIIWLRSGIISLEYSIGELENKKLESLKEAKFLLAERSSALSMQKVEKTAAKDLGLALADRTKVLYVRAGNTGPFRASFEKGSGEARRIGNIPDKATASPGRFDHGADAGVGVYNGGYQ